MATRTAKSGSRRGVSRTRFGPYQPLPAAPVPDQKFRVAFTDDFEADTAGSLPAGWVNGGFVNTVTGAFVVSATSPIKGTKSLRDPAVSNGGAAFYNTSLDDQEILFVTRVGTAGSTSHALLRSNKTTQGYSLWADASGDLLGAYLMPAFSSPGSVSPSAQLGRAAVAGDLVWVRARAAGSLMSVRVWLDGQAEPAAWQFSFEDSTYTAGFCGVGTGTGDSTPHAFDNVTVSDLSYRTADDPGFAYLGRWGPAGAVRTTITNGSSCEFGYTGNSCVLHFDVSAAAIRYPGIAYRVDDGPWVRALLDSSGTVTIAPTYNTAPSGTPPFDSVRSNVHHVRFLAIVDYEPAAYDDWTTLRDALRFQGAVLGAGGLLLVVPANPNQIEFLGDSITGGQRLLLTSATDEFLTSVPTDAPEANWTEMAAGMLGLAPVVNGHGGHGIVTAAHDGAPAALAALPYVYGTTPYAPAQKPVVAVVYQGTNDSAFTSAQYLAYITGVRAQYPGVYLFAVVPFQCARHVAAITAAVVAFNDTRTFFLDYSAAFATSDTSDGLHFNPGGAVRMACRLANDVSARLASLGVRVGRAGWAGG